MKNRSLFSQLIILIVIAIICFTLTLLLSLWAGSNSTNLLDWEKINWSNALPVLLIGGFICCVTVGILVLFIARNILKKWQDFFARSNKNGGNSK